MTKSQTLKIAAVSALIVVLLVNTGCVGFTTWLIFVLKGEKHKAEFNGLKEKRVAVICVSDSSAYGSDAATEMLARLVTVKLGREVKKIDIVRQQEVYNWIDNNNWDEIDYVEVGRGVDADMLVVVELANYRLTKGRTLYQGHVDMATSVFDMSKSGDLVFYRKIPAYEFPKNGGRPQSDHSRSQFEQQFLVQLSHQVANYFYNSDVIDGVATDAIGVNQ